MRKGLLSSKFIQNCLIVTFCLLSTTHAYSSSEPALKNNSPAPVQNANGLKEEADPTKMRDPLPSVSDKDNREQFMKAAFLRYAAKFTTWPADVEDPSEINLCVYSKVKSIPGMNSVNGRAANDKILNIRYITDYKKALEPKACHVLYVTEAQNSESKEIIELFKEKPILTFGDLESFPDEGGCMGFQVLNNRMAILINMNTVTKSKLELSPRMVRLVSVIPNARDMD